RNRQRSRFSGSARNIDGPARLERRPEGVKMAVEALVHRGDRQPLWLKRRPTRAEAILVFWTSIVPPAMPQAQLSRTRCSIQHSLEWPSPPITCSPFDASSTTISLEKHFASEESRMEGKP